jgi:hypothetical protein
MWAPAQLRPFDFIVKADVGMSAENHVASAICGAVVWVRCQVVEELFHGSIGGFSGCGLLGA